MPFTKHYDQQPAAKGPACIHLRSKSMFISGEIKSPEHPTEAGANPCWCNMTQHVRGPDDQLVGRSECTSGRECFRETW
jgi:hypothetical protein